MKAVSREQALRIFEGNDPSYSGAQGFIAHVNSCLMSKEVMAAHACSPSIGSYFQFSRRQDASPEDCAEIENAFRAAGWVDVLLSYHQGMLSITLEWRKARGFGSRYNGQLLSELVASPVPA